MLKRFVYLLLAVSPLAVHAQSTFGTVLGTVKDNSGSMARHCRQSRLIHLTFFLSGHLHSGPPSWG